MNHQPDRCAVSFPGPEAQALRCHLIFRHGGMHVNWDAGATWPNERDRGASSAGVAPATDQTAEAVASCPGRELDPNPCRCPCYGCKHHCGAHNPDDVPDAARAGLIDRIRRVLARCDGFDFDSLEPHDYQIQAAALAAVLPASVDRADDEAPLSPDYQHPECGFNWHGRDGMDIPMRDGQPVCPRCELAAVEKRLRHSEKRSDELRAESKRRGKVKLEYAERIRQLENQLDEVHAQLGAEILRAGQAEDELRRVAAETHNTTGPDAAREPIQHAPGVAILCPDCRTKGRTVCVDDRTQPPVSRAHEVFHDDQGQPHCVDDCPGCTAAAPPAGGAPQPKEARP